MGQSAFVEWVDIKLLQQLADLLYKVAGFPIGIVDLEDTILVSAGWQDICICFHRAHPQSYAYCIENYRYIKQNLREDAALAHRCKNGLWDIAFPIIVDGEHKANLFIGQFFYSNEAISYEKFRLQAEQYGYDMEGYLNAIDAAPRLRAEQIEEMLRYSSEFIAWMATQEKEKNACLRRLALLEKSEAGRTSSDLMNGGGAFLAEKYKTIFNATNDTLLLLDTETGKILDINDAGLRLYNFQREDVVNISLSELELGEEPYSEKDAIEWIKKAQKFGPQRFEWYVHTDPAHPVCLEVSLSCLTVSQRYCILVVGRDITEQKEAEEVLAEREYLFRAMFNQNVQPICVLDSEGIIIDINGALLQLVGAVADELIPLHFWEIPWKELSLSMQDRIQEATKNAAEGHPVWVEASLQDAHEEMHNLVFTFTPVRNEKQEKLCIVVVGHDITQIRKTEQELRESEERFRLLVENCQDGILLCTARGKMIDLNREMCHTLGYSKEELLRMSVPDINPEYSEEKIQELWGRVQKGKFVLFETQQHRKDGSVYPVEVKASRFPHHGTNLFLAMIRDLTERKQAEAERNKLTERIHRAQKYESLSTLSGGIAHHLNNIMHAIGGYVELLSQGIKENDPKQKYITEILKSVARASELSKQMLVCSGHDACAMESVDLNALVQEMRPLFSLDLPKDVTLKYRLSGTVLRVQGNPAQIRQVLLNLLKNAVEAMENRTGSISIESGLCAYTSDSMDDACLNAPPEQGAYAYLNVRDQGVGMNEEVCQRVFDPFFSTKFAARGLGMAAVLGVMQAHHGAVYLESKPEVGTTVQLLFPAQDAGGECLTEPCPFNNGPPQEKSP